eukprot:TRINITY_DN3225_c0_g3_i1.p1 TRINITY_DN3225_c0_g3~~TRINITY_DN3225_c0_g3_i1.p1  ORF type:complete len:863 (-),score=108.51 TRINITY_DN3225_c0_g3_i1:1221-3809(-)
MAERTVAVEQQSSQLSQQTPSYWNPETTYAYAYNQYQQGVLNQYQQQTNQFYPVQQAVATATPTPAAAATQQIQTQVQGESPPGAQVTQSNQTVYGYWPVQGQQQVPQQQQTQYATTAVQQQPDQSQSAAQSQYAAQYAEYYRQYYQYYQQQQQLAAWQLQQQQQQQQLQQTQQLQQQQLQQDRPTVSFNIKNSSTPHKAGGVTINNGFSQAEVSPGSMQVVTLAQQQQQEQPQQQQQQQQQQPPPQPAYVQVVEQQQSEPQQAKKQTRMYSLSLQEYIKRSFKACGTDDASVGKLKQALQEIIETAKEQGVLDTWDWGSTATPLVNDEVVIYKHILTSLQLANTKNSNSNSRTVHILTPKKTSSDNQVSSPPPPLPPPSDSDEPRDDEMKQWGQSYPHAKKRSQQHKSYNSSKFGKRHHKHEDEKGESDDDGEDTRQIYSKLKRRLEKAKAKNKLLGQSLAHQAKVSKKKYKRKSRYPSISQRQRSPVGHGDNSEDSSKSRSREEKNSTWSDLTSFMNSSTTAGTGEVVQGTCQTLEKEYFRLTCAPDPSQVRPEPVLKRAYHRLLDLIQLKDPKYAYKNYFWSQFKAIRQDLVVQHIHNDFAVRVYEANARAALQYGDMAEFNQCQSQLSQLYSEGLQGCGAAFAAYRILYRLVYPESTSCNLLYILQEVMSGPYGQSEHVQHACEVRKAYAAKDYVRFFKLYRQCPGGLGCHLMDVKVEQMRFDACDLLVKSHKPSAISVLWMSQQLGFVEDDVQPMEEDDSDENRQVLQSSDPLPGCSEAVSKKLGMPKEEGVLQCMEWLQLCGATLTTDSTGNIVIDTKQSSGNLSIPRVENAVAHGDANLDVSDFMTKSKRKNNLL